MTIKLDKLSKDELLKLKADVENALKTLDVRRKAEAKKAAEMAAKEHGFSLDDLFSKSGGKRKNPPKYQNPADPSQTWTGRGRKPNWVKDALDAGKSMSDMEI